MTQWLAPPGWPAYPASGLTRPKVLGTGADWEPCAIAALLLHGVRDVIRNFNADEFSSLSLRYKGRRPALPVIAWQRHGFWPSVAAIATWGFAGFFWSEGGDADLGEVFLWVGVAFAWIGMMIDAIAFAVIVYPTWRLPTGAGSRETDAQSEESNDEAARHTLPIGIRHRLLRNDCTDIP